MRGCSCDYGRVQNKKFEIVGHFPILHEFDWPCVQSECTMVKLCLAILEKWSEIGQWPAVILHSAMVHFGVTRGGHSNQHHT